MLFVFFVYLPQTKELVIQRQNNGKMNDGRKNIIGKGFDAHPENINKDGRAVSIKTQLKKLLQKDGELPLRADAFLRMETKAGKEYYIFKIPTQQALALRLSTLAMTKNKDTFQALKLMLETFDGKAKQEISIKEKQIPTIINKSGKELDDNGLVK